MKKTLKIACCLMLAVASVWFSISFRGGRTFFRVGNWEREVNIQASLVINTPVVAEASKEDSGDTDFA